MLLAATVSSPGCLFFCRFTAAGLVFRVTPACQRLTHTGDVHSQGRRCSKKISIRNICTGVVRQEDRRSPCQATDSRVLLPPSSFLFPPPPPPLRHLAPCLERSLSHRAEHGGGATQSHNADCASGDAPESGSCAFSSPTDKEAALQPVREAETFCWVAAEILFYFVDKDGVKDTQAEEMRRPRLEGPRETHSTPNVRRWGGSADRK